MAKNEPPPGKMSVTRESEIVSLPVDTVRSPLAPLDVLVARADADIAAGEVTQAPEVQPKCTAHRNFWCPKDCAYRLPRGAKP